MARITAGASRITGFFAFVSYNFLFFVPRYSNNA